MLELYRHKTKSNLKNTSIGQVILELWIFEDQYITNFFLLECIVPTDGNLQDIECLQNPHKTVKRVILYVHTSCREFLIRLFIHLCFLAMQEQSHHCYLSPVCNLCLQNNTENQLLIHSKHNPSPQMAATQSDSLFHKAECDICYI